jgi:hypothetical protein
MTRLATKNKDVKLTTIDRTPNTKFVDKLSSYITECSKDGHGRIAILSNYFKNFTGGKFEFFGDNNPFKITTDDIVAVTMLSMEIRYSTRSGITPRTILSLMEHQEHIEALLRRLQDNRSSSPTSSTLETLSEEELSGLLTGETSAAQELVSFLFPLFSQVKVSESKKWVAVSKLLSRKRPGLLPIRDNKVATRLGYSMPMSQNSYLADWWTDWHWAITANENMHIKNRLSELQAQLAEDKELEFVPSLIRIADVLVWNGCTCNSIR